MVSNNLLELMGKYPCLNDVFGYLKRFKVGDVLPSERNMEIEVGYTRSTIRECLIRLECFGFIQIKQGKPTKVLKEFTI